MRSRIMLQAAFVFAFAASATLLVSEFGTGSPVNLLWAVLVPVLIAVVFNKRLTDRIVLAAAWVGLSLVTVAITTNLVGLGPS